VDVGEKVGRVRTGAALRIEKRAEQRGRIAASPRVFRGEDRADPDGAVRPLAAAQLPFVALARRDEGPVDVEAEGAEAAFSPRRIRCLAKLLDVLLEATLAGPQRSRVRQHLAHVVLRRERRKRDHAMNAAFNVVIITKILQSKGLAALPVVRYPRSP
jgi:hypothetical protein